jgi:hypothetical protein
LAINSGSFADEHENCDMHFSQLQKPDQQVTFYNNLETTVRPVVIKGDDALPLPYCMEKLGSLMVKNQVDFAWPWQIMLFLPANPNKQNKS